MPEPIKNLMRLLSTALLPMLGIVGGCSSGTSDRDLRFVTCLEAMQILEQKTGAFGSRGDTVNVWLDPRTLEEYEEGHIPRAISLPFPEIENSYESRLRSAASIVVYDSNWNDVIAVSASKRLMELGHSDVYTLKGGLEAWIADGHDVEKGAPSEAVEEQAGRQ